MNNKEATRMLMERLFYSLEISICTESRLAEGDIDASRVEIAAWNVEVLEQLRSDFEAWLRKRGLRS